MARQQFFDPTTGLVHNFKKQTDVEFAQKIAITYMSDPSVVVGDIVRPSTTVTDTVVSLTDNVYPNLAVGIVISKPSATQAEVLISGRIAGFTGLVFGKPVFIGTSGEITTTVPTTGHQQKMGSAITSTEIFLLPSTEKVILSS